MKLIFLGTGSAFTTGDGNYQSNMMMISDSHKRLLIDCGSDVRFALNEQKFCAEDVTDVYISHLHSDHCGGLEWLALMTYFMQNPPKRPKLHVPKDITEPLWEHSLSAGLNTLQDRQASLSTYFEVKPILNMCFNWENIDFHLVPCIHIVSNHKLMPCYGLFFQIDEKKIFITSDTRYVPDLHKPYYDEADLIFHDCETYQERSGVHAHYSELVHLSPEIKQKTWLYHYSPGPLPDACADGFLGFVKKGQTFEF